MRQYYILGGTYGTESQVERFIKDGYWALGWTKEDQPSQYDHLLKMKPGDIIALKKKNGYATSDITILARGIVRGIITEANEMNRFVCTVNWFEPTILNKKVPMKHQTIKCVTGPLTLNDDHDWLVDVFDL